MMFLQYAVWGAWLPVAARYLSASTAEGGLGFTGAQIGLILGLAGSIGAMASPFIAGQLADRWFSTERFLAFLLATGGVIKWVTASQTSYGAWLWLSILYSVVYMPTLALSNSMAFAHLADRDREFPRVRVWGTIGWIVVSWVFPMIYLQTSLRLGWMPPFLTGPEVPNVTARLADALRFSAIISWGYAIFCLLLLPHTPPKKEGVEPLAVKKAFGLLRERSFLVLVIASLPIAIVHQIYFIQTPPFLSHLGLLDSQIGPAMTIGQFSEILMMVVLGGMLARFGFRAVITLGALAYFVRYFIWSTSLPVPVLVSSQILHGVCYAGFFAGAYIYTDRIAPDDIRHSAQTVFGILILGGGPVLGGILSGWLQARHTLADGSIDYAALWRIVAMIGLATAIFFYAMFREKDLKH